MAIPILGGLLDSVFSKVGDVVSEVVVDKDKRNEIKANLERLRLETSDKAQQRIHEQMLAQTAINKQEAGHASLFVAGWRPFVGWVSGVGLAYGVLLEPLFSWTARVMFKYGGSFPEIDATILMFALGGMLGIGTMRTVEKVQGVSRESLSDVSVHQPGAVGIPVEQLNMDPKTGRVKTPENAPWHT